MPSYQYTRDIKPEDLQPEQGPELTPKEKRKNWWHYHWKLVAILVAVALITGFFIAELVRKDTPDLTITLLTSKSMPDTVTELLSEQLGELVGDLNGDGKAIVEVVVCTIDPYDEEADLAAEAEAAEAGENGDVDLYASGYNDAYAQMAGVTRLSAAMGDEASMLYILETELWELYQQNYHILGYLDGTSPGDETSDYENMVIDWMDSPVLSGLDMDIVYDGGVFDGNEYMAFFSIGVRRIEGTSMADSETAVENHAYALELVNSWR